MHIQGWREGAGPVPCTKHRMNPGGRKDSASDAVAHYHSHDPARIEFLNTVKKRIKSGFYSSEAVIDDLGHGFAQALDNTL